MTNEEVPFHAVVGGRYRLAARASGVPTVADDTRLGRRVLVQHGVRALSSERLTARLVTVDHPAVVPLLDAGDDTGPDGTRRTFTVFPVGGVAFDAVPAERWRELDLTVVAGVAAWVVAAAIAVQASCGASVALCSGDLVVDPELFDGPDLFEPDRPGADCPVRWLPCLADRDDDLGGVIAGLVRTRSRREQRRLEPAAALLTTPGGRPRAVRLLAAVAGLDPATLGVAPHVPRHAGTARRSFGRRVLVGNLPATTRSDQPCASVEAFS